MRLIDPMTSSDRIIFLYQFVFNYFSLPLFKSFLPALIDIYVKLPSFITRKLHYKLAAIC